MTTALNWDWSNEADFNDEKVSADLLERNKYAKYIYEISSARGKDNHFALNINAQWGAGKTHFVKRLASTIKDAHPTVYIDAWKQDYSDDPLLAIFSCIIEQLGQQSDKFITISKKVEKKLIFLFKDLAPLLIKEAINGATGTKLGDAAKGITEGLIKLHNNKNNAIIDIKKDISEWVQLIKNQDAMEKNLPIYIFIDELDRCRPSYAIKLLEIVKHIFDVSGVVFIISTDTNQLQHSIKVIYGNEFDASHYLSRFFDRRFILPSPSIEQLLKKQSPDSVLLNFNSLEYKLHPQPTNADSFIKSCSSIFQCLNISLRESIKCYDKYCDLLLTQNMNVNGYLLLMLICLSENNIALYSEVKHNHKSLSLNQPLAQQEVTLSFDLSTEVTGVLRFASKNGYSTPNGFASQYITTNIIHYIKTAIDVINIKYPYTVQGNQKEYWSDGALSNDSSLESFLKMASTRTKTNNKEMPISNYFELVELSTLIS
ncbi:P-loop NTPase fold protein [Hafnia alvei]|uniref:KAP family P-loop NTPase fold protein n=1 Tax=Hafnia alvei TaxID=569 RepID=UPI0010342CC8|nr:P-loop NTPase fold protein [Hafnia alvei]TBL88912.1 NTPase KAP [Hafnia alvei]